MANNQAMDVYVPGQQPPNGAAALVRPSWTGNSKTWVGFRAGSGAGGNPAAILAAASRQRVSLRYFVVSTDVDSNLRCVRPESAALQSRRVS